MEIGYNYKDVLLIPQYSDIKHRDEVDLSSRLFKTGSFGPIKIPIVAANMDTIASFEMIKECHFNGAICFLHRYQSLVDTRRLILKLINSGITRIVPSIGVGIPEAETAMLYHNDTGIESINIDIAHGDCKQMLDTISAIKRLVPKMNIVAGNITTPEAARRLWNAGADAIKIGIGNGGVCETQKVTGAGYPQFSAIQNISQEFGSWRRPTLIADGGIREVGDITKALGAGADFVMIGSLFAGCPETPEPGIYRGMASQEAQEAFKGFAKNIEGKTISVEKKPPVSDILKSIKEGVQSGFTYCGARNIKELHKKAQFVTVR